MSTACFNVKLQNEKAPIQLEEVYPVTDEEGSNFNPYEFTITNNCNELAAYQINLEVLTSSSLENLDYIKASLNDDIKILTQNESVKTTLTEANKAYKLKTGDLKPKESETFYLRLWMDEETPAEEAYMNKTMLSKITITSSYVDHIPTDYEVCVNKYGADSMNCQVIASVDTSGQCPTVNEDGIISVNKTENMKGYVCSAPDDYGTSYYYRGVVDNNYVKFGGYYWRILRLNGDGSIRMIYAGDASVIDSLQNKSSVLSNGYNDYYTKYSQIGTSPYNEHWKKDNVEESSNSDIDYDNAGVGYMYGNKDGEIELPEDSSDSQNKTETYYYETEYTYDESIDEFSLSGEIKGVLGSDLSEDVIGLYTCQSKSSTGTCQSLNHVTSISFNDTENYNTIYYKNFIYGTTTKEKAQTNTNDSTIKEYLDTWYENHLKDTEYEKYIADAYYCNDRSLSTENPSGFSQLGYGPEKTAYKWYNNQKVSLTCEQQNDRFTVNDEVIGNKNLKYSIGLINADETYIAGGNSANNKYYLYTGNSYWTMSPFNYNGVRWATLIYVYEETGISIYNKSLCSPLGVPPVINLRANSLKLGSGTWNDPWRVE